MKKQGWTCVGHVACNKRYLIWKEEEEKEPCMMMVKQLNNEIGHFCFCLSFPGTNERTKEDGCFFDRSCLFFYEIEKEGVMNEELRYRNGLIITSRRRRR